ncbi:MAG TPA: hypothetical protein VFI70_01840 [Nitrososphaeraceae archaeon]|nr:hypothetical protein [Nitrososphaeraceae archaeon]
MEFNVHMITLPLIAFLLLALGAIFFTLCVTNNLSYAQLLQPGTEGELLSLSTHPNPSNNSTDDR